MSANPIDEILSVLRDADGLGHELSVRHALQRAYDAGKSDGRSEVWHVGPAEGKAQAVAFIGALATDNEARTRQAFLDAAAIGALPELIRLHSTTTPDPDDEGRAVEYAAWQVAEGLWDERERRRSK